MEKLSKLRTLKVNITVPFHGSCKMLRSPFIVFVLV